MAPRGRGHRLAGLILALAATLLAVGARAEPADARAEVAAALYAASATQTAFEKSADGRLRAERVRVAGLIAQVRAGDLRRRAELAAAQEGFVAELAARDRAYAEGIAVFRGAVTDIAATTEGAAALARFNAGDEAAALAVLDRLREANDKVRQKRADIESAAEARRIAELARDARTRGKQTTASVIARYEEVVRLDPAVSTDWLWLGRLRAEAGRLTQGRAAEEMAVRAARTDRERSAALDDLGDILIDQGDRSGARKAYETALAIDRRMAQADPAAILPRLYLAFSVEKIGDVLFAGGDLPGARRAFEEELAGFRRLAAADPADTARRRDVSRALARISETLAAQGDLAGARKADDESLAIARGLAAADPADVELQVYVAESLSNLAEVMTAQKSVAEAQTAYQECLAILRRLATTDPGDALIQRYLAQTLPEFGDLLVAAGDPAAARGVYEEGLATARLLSAADPADADARAWLARCIEKLAGLRRLDDTTKNAGPGGVK